MSVSIYRVSPKKKVDLRFGLVFAALEASDQKRLRRMNLDFYLLTRFRLKLRSVESDICLV